MADIEQRTELVSEHEHEPEESASVSGGVESDSGEGSEVSGEEYGDEDGYGDDYDEDEDSDIDSTDSTHPYYVPRGERKLVPLPPHIEVPLEVQIRILSHETSYEYTWERRIGKPFFVFFVCLLSIGTVSDWIFCSVCKAWRDAIELMAKTRWLKDAHCAFRGYMDVSISISLRRVPHVDLCFVFFFSMRSILKPEKSCSTDLSSS
jgi:hypothetical protein